MSLIRNIKLVNHIDASGVATSELPKISFEDRNEAEGAIVTNCLDGDLTSTPPRNYPKGNAKIRAVSRKTKGGVLHLNTNVKRTEPSGAVSSNPATNELYLNNVKTTLGTISVTIAIPAAVQKDPSLFQRFKLAAEADLVAISAGMIASLDDALAAS